MLCDRFDCTKGLTSILDVVDMQILPAIDLEMALTTRRHVNFKSVIVEQSQQIAKQWRLSRRPMPLSFSTPTFLEPLVTRHDSGLSSQYFLLVTLLGANRTN